MARLGAGFPWPPPALRAKQGGIRFRLRRPTVTQVLIGVFLPLVSGTGLLVAWIDSQRMNQQLTSASENLMQVRAGQLRGLWEAQAVRSRLMLEVVQGFPVSPSRERWLPMLPRFSRALATTPVITAYFIGWPDGSLVRVARVKQFAGQRLAGLPPNASLVVEVVDRRSALPSFHREVFDDRLHSLGEVEPTPALKAYNASQTNWYVLAQQARGDLAISPIRMLPLSGGLGITLSRRLRDGDGAAGASLLTVNIEKLLEQFRITPGTQLAIVDERGRLRLSPGREDDADRELPLRRSRIPALAAMDPQLQPLLSPQAPRRQPPRLRGFRAGGQD